MGDVAMHRPERATLRVAMGRRVAVLANLLLTPDASPATTWAANALARILDEWDGPGSFVVAGNLFDLRRTAGATPGPGPTDVDRALRAHPRLRDALERFAGGDGRQVICLPGHADGLLARCAGSRAALQALGVSVATGVEVVLDTAGGTRVVEIEAGVQPAALLPDGDLDRDAGDGDGDGSSKGSGTSSGRSSSSSSDGVGTKSGDGAGGARAPAPWAGLLVPDPGAPWQAGLDRLTDPGGARRFLTSRLLYRRFARFAWWLLIPYAVVLVLRDPAASALIGRLLHGHVVSSHVLLRARQAAWGTRLAVATVVAVLGLVVLGAVLALLGRKAWSALGGGKLDPPWRRTGAEVGATANDAARDSARSLLAAGRAGLVTGATPLAELSHLGEGFFACTGATGETVEEHPGRLGLPPVFLAHRQFAWVELETGAQLHARLMLFRASDPGATLLERLAARRAPDDRSEPAVVAAYPQGASWPPAPDLQAVRRRSRRVRRWAAAAIALAGAADLLSAVTAPLRSRLHDVLQVLPLGASQAAGALVALAGISLLALARGVRRGQRRAWLVSVAVLGTTVVLHLARGGDVVASLLAAGVLALLVTQRAEFGAASDRPSLRSAVLAAVGGVVLATVAATAAVELQVHVDRDPTGTVPLWRAVRAVVERLWGVRSVPLPARVDGFLSPSLLVVGVTLLVVTVLLATRPVVQRARGGGRVAEQRARDIVRRHGQGTLDYFALRSDKQWFFHRDSVVAYGLYGGICLVSPDPIGPTAERAQVWAAFRRFADSHGWAVSVMGACEQWLPVYRVTGMRDVYIGDEAVVDVQRFSLAGGHMKGLRQAFNRVARYGYSARFCDPARIDAAEAERLAGLLDQSRRGDSERGFSMMLGRLFDRRDEGLLMCVVDGPDGSPVAMCQFVPAPGIGGYSLDLMRRARGDHPNGLIDFALVSTIEHLRERNLRGLSLNFAALRSVLDGERGDSLPVRVERWALERMSSILQIETLWRFNAKYDPDWLPRYVSYDAAEHLVPTILAILRAESLWEVPVLGRLIAAAERRARPGDGAATAATGATAADAASADRAAVAVTADGATVAATAVLVAPPGGGDTPAPSGSPPAATEPVAR